jgi:hypothetical protein
LKEDRKNIDNLDYEIKLQDALNSVCSRNKLMPRKETRIGAWLKSLLARCIKSLRRDDSLFWQAKGQLARELDVKHFIRQSRMVRNALMILTTKRERRLIKMQSRLNVLVHKDERTEDDSSEFLSEEHEGYIKKLIDRE